MGYGGGTAVPNDQTKPAHHICSHGLETAGFSREITLVDQGFTDDLSQHVTEVSIPVRGIK